MNLLDALPVILRWLPALVDVVAAAMGGGHHVDEGAWCAHIKGLEDVCHALRNHDIPTAAVVHEILKDVDPNTLGRALERLRSRLS